MNLPRWRSPFAFLLLLVLLVPILAACGGTAATPSATTAANTQATTAATEPTTAATDAEETEAAEEPTEAATEVAAEDEATAEATTAAGAAGGDETAVSPADCGIENPGNCFRAPMSDAETIDPQRSSFSDEITVLMLNYLPLMTFDQELNVIPGAAESYELSEDGLTFTFTLRPDQTYSDGEPLTAENFEYGWKRLCDPRTAGEYVSIAYPVTGCQEFSEAFATGGLTVTDEAQLETLAEGVGVNAVDENTLEIQLKESAPYFLNVAALWVGAPTRQDLVEAGGDAWWTDPANMIGNGPFQLTEYEPQSRFRFERNENYVLEKPNIEAIEGTVSEDSAVLFQAYLSDELDWVGIAAEDKEAVESDPELEAQRVTAAGSCSFYFGFNNTKPPFDNKEVRQAFAMAIDREAWVEDVLQGQGIPSTSFIPPGIPGHDPDITTWQFDPEGAKAKLEAAGFDFDQELQLTFAASPRNQARFEWLAASFQNNLGVTMTLDPIEPTAYTALLKEPLERTPPMYFLGWCADYPDAQNYLSLVFQPGGTGEQRTGYNNPEFLRLTREADLLPVDDPERAELYRQAQEILHDDAPVAFMYYNIHDYLFKPWVKGLGESQTPLDYFPGIFNLSGWEIAHE